MCGALGGSGRPACQDQAVRTRIAPTPSGYLHRGNAANALLTHWWAQSEEGTVLLRIDDIDAPRVRPEYVDDIHDLLRWIGIAIEVPDGFSSGVQGLHTRASRIERARAALRQALAAGMPAYACTCSRSLLGGIALGGCPGGCRTAGHELEPGTSALRIAVPEGTRVAVDGQTVDLADVMGDFVIWRRDDLPAYQWISVVEDTELQVTHILRGVDLLESSAAQTHLARFLPDPRFLDTQIRHHGLVVDDQGVKLAKSQIGAETGLPRTEQVRLDVQRIAREWGDLIGLPTH